jgi:serine-type D-Ala-D-Ala carboxypeptidase/endopeptidase (penicillin-binding protein 4)
MAPVVDWKGCLAGIVLLLVSGAYEPAWGASPRTEVPLEKKLARWVGASDAVMVAAPDGRTLVSIAPDRLLVPASILKVVTALAALHYLGEEFRFATDFYQDAEGRLIVKGYGDPLLVSERVDRISRQLAGQIRQIGGLVLDDSYFADPITVHGRGRSMRPYDAPNGALSVNFNTVFFERRDGDWISAEPQTPLLPLAVSKIKGSGLTTGRIPLAADRSEILNYAGELLHYFLSEAGIQTNGTITFGQADPQKDTLLWRHQSDLKLTEIIADLLDYSNNFIANQLLLVMGAHASGPPADMEKGVQALRRYYESELGLKTGHIEEGSGISRRNRMSAQAMMTVLERFAPYYPLMRRQGRQYYKTGTLKDVRTRAGYLQAADGGFYRFVVMVNTPDKTTDRIMQILEGELK